MGTEKKSIKLKIPLKRQPDDVTCGPTCLQSIYGFYHDGIALEHVIEEVSMLEEGGTFASKLGTHSLKRGYQAHIWSFNVHIFDPSWFDLSSEALIQKLKLQKLAKKNKKLRYASDGYLEFLNNGGQLHFEDLTSNLLVSLIQDGVPIIVGLSSTYLYRTEREDPKTNVSNDIAGRPAGHFVLVTGIDLDARTAQITDPYFPNNISQIQTYTVPIARLICAIMLGVMTYDANLLVIKQKESSTA
ncbi:MAG: peptidase-C39 like family protein [Bdellovibrionota bacterium]|nr:MAG: peptidase-C39 like family protein [Pseudomonadota bacterium]